MDGGGWDVTDSNIHDQEPTRSNNTISYTARAVTMLPPPPDCVVPPGLDDFEDIKMGRVVGGTAIVPGPAPTQSARRSSYVTTQWVLVINILILLLGLGFHFLEAHFVPKKLEPVVSMAVLSGILIASVAFSAISLVVLIWIVLPGRWRRDTAWLAERFTFFGSILFALACVLGLITMIDRDHNSTGNWEVPAS
jgi:hypothetical protein